MLLWPPQTYTSPNSTSSSCSDAPPSLAAVTVYGPPGCTASKATCHTPAASAVAGYTDPGSAELETFTPVPGSAKPQMLARSGARCSTMWDPSDAANRNALPSAFKPDALAATRAAPTRTSDAHMTNVECAPEAIPTALPEQ